MAQTVLILDFGGQYKELIARRVRECSVYSIVKAGDLTAEQVQALNPIGIILTGGPNSVYLDDSPHCDKRIFELGIPVLGICYGAQLTAWSLGGTVAPCATSEYGKTAMEVDPACALFKGLSAQQIGLMSHTDQCAPAGLYLRGAHSLLPERSDGLPGAEDLRRAVPPRGRIHAERHADHPQLPL